MQTGKQEIKRTPKQVNNVRMIACAASHQMYANFTRHHNNIRNSKMDHKNHAAQRDVLS